MNTRQNRPMIPMEEFKALLGALAPSRSDDELLALRAMQYDLADAVFDWWLDKRTGASVPDDSPETNP